MIINSPNIIGVATGSLFGTASYATQALSASYAPQVDVSAYLSSSWTSSVFGLYTSSINNWTSSVTTTSSFGIYTASINNWTSSVATTSSFNTYTSSINSYTASLNLYTGSKTSQFAGTASFSQNTANPNYKIVSSSYTLLETDSIIEVISGSVTQSLFTAVGYPGKNITIINASTGSIMILANGSETIGNLFSGNSTSMSVYSQDAPTMVSNNSNWRLI